MDKPINSMKSSHVFDLKQHVNFPTHVPGRWLDLLIAKRTSNSIKTVLSNRIKRPKRERALCQQYDEVLCSILDKYAL